MSVDRQDRRDAPPVQLTHPPSADYSLADQPMPDEGQPVADRTPGSSAGHAEKADELRQQSLDALGYPPPGDIRVTADRREHILDGNQTGGGGHRHGMGSPGKTEFPADWDDGKIMDNVLRVAREPDDLPVRQNWNGRWQVQGERDGVKIVAVVTSDGSVWTAWPREGSPGVVKNVKDKPEDS